VTAVERALLRQPLVVACLGATWFIWGSSYLAIKVALTGFPPFFLMGSRFVLAGSALMLCMRPRRAEVPLPRYSAGGADRRPK
jgi:drug/metabolite transporter (DMT)-like permease